MRVGAVVLALAVTVSGCDGCRGAAPVAPEVIPGDRSSDPEATLGLDPGVAQRRVALVDDEPVTVLDLARELEQASSMVAARHADHEGRLAMLDAMLLEHALAAEAVDRGHGDDFEVVRAREELLVRALVAQIARDVPEPSEESVRAVFDAHRDRYRAPARRAVGLIFTRDRARGDEALAQLLAGDLRNRPRDWMAAAERIGFAGPRRQPREETDLFAAVPRAGEPFVPQAVRDAAFATEPGAIYPELVPFEDGFYVVQVSSSADAMDIPFEDVAQSIRSQLHDEAVDSALTQLVASRLAVATYDDAALATVLVPGAPEPAAQP